MRLLHVTHQYRPAIGGAEQHITAISEELVQRGHHVTVATSRSRDYLTWKNELPAGEVLSGVHVRRFRSATRGEKTLHLQDWAYTRYWKGRARCLEPIIFWCNGPVCPGLFGHVLREGPNYDLVHINHLHFAHAALAFHAARRRRLPIVTTPHIHLDQALTYDPRYLQAILMGSQHVLTDTEAERQFLIDVGFDPRAVTTAGTGIHVEQFPILDRHACRERLGLPDHGYVLLFLGRKTEYKGLSLVLQAFSALRTQVPDLYLVTMGAETDYSRGLMAQHAASPRWINYGGVDDPTRLAALNACDCLVLPSTGEAFGIVFLEAWAVGKPVIAAATGAVSSVVTEGQDGYLIAPGHTEQLAERIAHLARDREAGREMGRRGRAKVLNRYTVPRVADIVEGVYLRVLRQERRRAHPAGSGTDPARWR
jgi:glycosyltransferase involved in cell wall biosynthesis